MTADICNILNRSRRKRITIFLVHPTITEIVSVIVGLFQKSNLCNVKGVTTTVRKIPENFSYRWVMGWLPSCITEQLN